MCANKQGAVRAFKARSLLPGVLTLALLLTPLGAQAQFTFVTNNGAITITRYIGSAGAVVIPDTTNGYPVVSIGANAFLYSSNLTSVNIPNSVTSIGDFAFSSCGRLTSATIPTNATDIGDYAFSGCRSLTNVTIPNGLISIGDRPFASCGNLTNISVAVDNPSIRAPMACCLTKVRQSSSNFLPAGAEIMPSPTASPGSGTGRFPAAGA